jgi:hypothetical protein
MFGDSTSRWEESMLDDTTFDRFGKDVLTRRYVVVPNYNV